MSGALPFPTSDNRSLISGSPPFPPAAAPFAPYAHPRGAQLPKQPAAVPRQLPYTALADDPRHAAHPPTDMAYVAHGPPRMHPSGSLGAPTDQERPTHVSQAYPSSLPYRDPYAQLHPGTMYSGSEDSALSTYAHPAYEPAAVSDARSRGSHSSLSRSPPGATQALSPASDGAKPAAGRPQPKRREKPHIDLAPDQPLTTQGKPRARVYVACVQCRTRKIRCDGARPVCLHCSRRAATGTDDGVLCSYDAAPKRRGPDKNPGSRQRVPAPESSDGGKVRRRRRRDTGADRASIPMAAAGPSSPLAGELREPVPKVPQHALAPYLAHAPAAAGAAREMRIQDVYRAPQQPLPAGEPLGAHGASLRGITHPSNSLERVATVSEPQYSHTQLSTQISPTQQYHQLSAAEGLPYPRYLPLPSSSGSQANREYEYDDEVDQQSSDIGAEPSLRTTRDTWWDALIALYTTHMQPQGAVLTPGVRESMAQQITSDLRFLFRASNYWFSFFNVPRFFANLMDPAKRAALQPSLILAALAAANFIRSSEQESGQAGRAWSLTLLEQAQAMLESSINARWIDESLVQASWLIAFFEISAHPLHNGIRVRSALSMLDSLVRSLAMAALDRTDARASRFAARAVPTVSPAAVEYGGGGAAGPTWDVAPHTGAHAHAHHHTGAPPQRTPPAAGECACGAYTLGRNWSHAQELTPLWLMTPAWSEDATDAEIRKEECRRLVWSSVTMVAGYTSFTAANNVMPAVDLSLMDPANYALLFPGEGLMAAAPGAKETVWALYMRTMLLWHACVRTRWDAHRSDAEKAQFAVTAWLEADRIEKALDAHTCGIERAFLFQGREYLFNSRMCISFEFQRYIPSVNANVNMAFHRQKAEEWLRHQASVAKRTMYGLQTITGQPNVTLARRPFFGFWFISQVSRALLLWSCDQTLTVALEVSKALLGPIEYLMSMWPCAEQRKRYRELRAALSRACYAAGIPPPSPSPQESRNPLPVQ